MIIQHEVGVLRLKKVSILCFPLLLAGLGLSCGGYSSSSGSTNPNLKYRAFVTNSVSAGTLAAGVYIVDAQNDVRANASALSAGNNPGMMVLTPNRAETLVFSGSGTQGSDNQLTVLSNGGQSAIGHVILPGMTKSFIVSPDSSAAYAAVPTAPVTGQSPGVVEVLSVAAATVTSTISCPPYNPNTTTPMCLPNLPPPCSPAYNCGGFNAPYTYLSIGNLGNRILAFSEGSDDVANAIAVITPSSVGTANPVITFVPGFDHPVWAYFNSDDTTAYVLNCGPECGGQHSSIQPLDMTTTPPTPGVAVNIPAGSVALVNNSTMYLAGTPVPASPCTGETTQATTCGFLTVFDLNSMSVVNPSGCAVGTNCPYIITDGYHDHIAMGANGQLFIGAHTCTEVIPPQPPPPGAEVRGCLSIFNTLTTAVGSVAPSGVLIPSANGDVTGLQPIATRQVVYLVQGGTLTIYNALSDTLFDNPHDSENPGQIFGLVGQMFDVKTVDF